METYTTADDAKDAIAKVIEAGGAAKAPEYDLDAIFDDCFEYQESTQEFMQTVDVDEFWASVDRHAL